MKPGTRVTILHGYHAGATGRISQRAHADVRPIVHWLVELDPEFRGGPESWLAARAVNFVACHVRDLGPYRVPKHARPASAGVLR